MPIGIKKLVGIQQSRKARQALAWKKFEKRRQIFGTDMFRGQERVPDLMWEFPVW
jgi:hypothetical protein